MMGVLANNFAVFQSYAGPADRRRNSSSPIERQILANSVEQLEEALRWAARSRIEKATFHFLTGLRRLGSLSA